MGSRQEDVVRSWLDCLAVGDLEGVIDHYSEDARYHVAAWHEPLVGRNAIRAELSQQLARLSDYRYTLLNIASTDAVVLIEVVDSFKLGGKDVIMHWSSVQEINPAGKITAQRDYYDMKEFEAQLA
jgi:limonene-1,2-epoxide hydrolase